EERRVAAAVAQEDRLAARAERRRDLLAQALRDVNLAGRAARRGLSQVDQDALGELPLPGARGQDEQRELPRLGVQAALEARRRRDEDGDGAGVPRPHEREVAAVVAGCHLL